MNKTKEKLKYNLWQNIFYVLRNTWVRDKIVLYVIFAEIILTVSLTLVSLFLPKTVIEQLLNNTNIKTIVLTVVGFTVLITALSALNTYFTQAHWVRRRELRNKVYNEILNKVVTTDYANLEKNDFILLKEKAMLNTDNNNATVEAIYTCFTGIGINALGFVILSIILVKINPVILIITLFTTAICYFVNRWAYLWQLNNNDVAEDYEIKLDFLYEVGSLSKYSKEIRLFAMTPWIEDIQRAYSKLAYNHDLKINKHYFISDITDCILTFLREGLAYVYLIWQVIEGNITADMFVLYFGAIGCYSEYILGFMNENENLRQHNVNYCGIREFLEYPDEFKHESGENIVFENVTSKSFKLEAKNLSYRYSDSENYILENINLTINSGEKIAVVGMNGTGKTTLVKLLCGFYDPTEGELLLNGRNIKEFNRKSYYKLFTAVFQEFSVLPKSVAENVAQTNLENIDIERLKNCLELADIHKKIDLLPKRENTQLVKAVNDEAVELSGGEIQQLMLARALYKNSPILILDEPTAALDPIAEDVLYKRYNELSRGKTSIYISHRLVSTRFCDRIILLGEKAILEEGSHQELLDKKGRYYELYKIQSKYYKEELEEIE